MAFSFINRFEESFPLKLSAQQCKPLSEELEKWQANVSSKVNGKVGFVPINIHHGWHGNKVDRGYNDRWDIIV